MEDLILKYKNNELFIESFDEDNELGVTVYADKPTYFYLTPSQTRELIAHLTNCLKEVENG